MAKPFKGGSGGAYAPQGISGGFWGGNAPPGKPSTLKKGDGENWQGGRLPDQGRVELFRVQVGRVRRGGTSFSHAFLTPRGRRIKQIVLDSSRVGP